MAEIFISYARADRERAQDLADAFGREGWSVWWDRDIPPGRTFDEVIEEALGAAKCVIVLWTRESVRSEWVKAEASEAARRHVLVPVLTDHVMPPLEFRRIQAASLLGADLSSNPDWSQLRQAVGELVGRPARQRTKSDSPDPAPPPAPRPSWRVASLFLGALTVVVVGWLAVAVRPRPPAGPRVAEPVPPAQNAPMRPGDGNLMDSDQTPQPTPHEAVEAAPPPIEPTRLPSKPPSTAPPSVASSTGTTSLGPRPVGISPLPASGVASFDVIYTHGVFRESGRLTVSVDGVRYVQPGGRSTFSAGCGDLKSVRAMTVIVDGEQRMVELHTKDRVHRFTTASQAARNSVMSALSRSCDV